MHVKHHEIASQQRQKYRSRLGYAAIFAASVLAMLFLSSEPAMAQQSPMGNVICAIIGIIYGNLGRGLAVLAVLVVGIGATLGKVSWGLAMTVAVGIGTVFGAVPLVAYLISANASTSICFGVAGIQ